MPDNPVSAKHQEMADLQLRVKLTRLRRVKEELRDECQPVPPKLEEEIHELSDLRH